MIVNDIGLTKDSYSHIYTADGNEIGTVYDREGHVIYYMYRDTIGDGSRVFTSYGAPIKDYKIYGNTFQDGTPSSDYPVDVVGCGVKTENLWDKTSATKKIIAYTGVIEDNLNGWALNRIKIKPNTIYYVYSVDSDYTTSFATYWQYLDSNNNIVGDVRYGRSLQRVALYMTPENAEYMNICFQSAYYNDGEIRDFVIIEGSAPPDHYIPYGYKLPETITNGIDTITTPIYIGSEPIHRIGNYADYAHYSINKIVRRIAKWVFTGNEPGIISGSSKTFFIPLNPAARRTRFAITVLSNKYKGIYNTWDWDIYGASDKVICFVANSPDPGPTPGYSLAINESRFGGNVSAFRAYLAAQYAAGTPVTIWYVLYEPIEEDPPVPFPELPTLTGTNTLTVDTPVKPSEIDLTGRLKTSGYGQLLDSNLTAINDSTGRPIFIRG